VDWQKWNWLIAPDWSHSGRIVAYDNHDQEVQPGARPGRVNYRMTSDAPWQEIADEGIPDVAAGQGLSLFEWDAPTAVLTTDEHGLYARRIVP
jgi:hypothetical protein